MGLSLSLWLDGDCAAIGRFRILAWVGLLFVAGGTILWDVSLSYFDFFSPLLVEIVELF